MKHYTVGTFVIAVLGATHCGGDADGTSQTAQPSAPAVETGAGGSGGQATLPTAIVPSTVAADDAMGQTPNPAGGSSSGGSPASGGQSTATAGSAGASATATNPAEPPPEPIEQPTPEPQPLGPLTLYIASDSTVQTYVDTDVVGEIAGWGQMLGLYLDVAVTIDNRAIGGRTARRFIDEGRLDEIATDITAGDYLLVQWGTNDGNRTATYDLNGQTIPYYLDPATDFKDYLGQYIAVARAASATIVLVTPPPRNSAYCTGGNGTGGHAQAMRELAADEGLAVSDLNQMSVAYLMAICPSPTPEDFFLLRADGTVDGTHFQENGARILASLVAEGIGEAAVPLAQFLR